MKNKVFSKKIIENNKTSAINTKGKIQKLDLSNISISNSCSSIIFYSKKLRSLSKKRDEKKIFSKTYKR